MARINEKPGKVSFIQAIKDFFIGYVDFKGRSTRAGYWWTVLALSISGFVLTFAVLGKVFGIISRLSSSYYSIEDDIAYAFADSMGLIIGILIFCLAIVLPSVALAVRRYRDAGLRGRGTLVFYIINFASTFFDISGTSSFLTLITTAISIFLFVLSVLPSDALTTTSDNDVILFFLRKKEAFNNEDSEWADY